MHRYSHRRSHNHRHVQKHSRRRRRRPLMQEGGDWVQDAKDKATTAFKTLADKGVAVANKAITTGVAAANTAISVNPLANKAKQMAEQLAKHGAQAQSALQNMGVSVPSVTTAVAEGVTAASTEPADVVAASPSVSTEQAITTTPADTATVVTPSATAPEPTAAVTPSATAVVTEGTAAQFDHIVNALNALDQKIESVVQEGLIKQHAGTGNDRTDSDGIEMTDKSNPINVPALPEDLKKIWHEFFKQYITTLSASMRSITLLEANNTSNNNKQSLSQIYQSILELIKTLNNSGSTIVGNDIVNEDAIQQIEQFVTNSEVPTPTFTQAEQTDPETISTVAMITSMGLAAVALLGGSNSKQTQEGGYKHRHHKRKHRHHKRD
jgi:hypothetical protein